MLASSMWVWWQNEKKLRRKHRIFSNAYVPYRERLPLVFPCDLLLLHHSHDQVPPRPMYFGHYQQLIYNQANPIAGHGLSRGGFESTRELTDFSKKAMQGAGGVLMSGENR